jgi:hypothetical protein
MEQSVRSDSTCMPTVQVETRDPEQEARVAALLTGPAPNLYDACTEQVERLDRWDADPESLTVCSGSTSMPHW